MASKISLLDLELDIRLVEWYVAYYPREPHFFWAKWLKQGFRHCDLWRPYYLEGHIVAWLRLTPTFEMLESSIEFDPTPPWTKHPQATIQRVQVLSKAYRMRQWFHLGPVSCTEICKNALGINSFWMRTPHQLYQHIRRRGGILK